MPALFCYLTEHPRVRKLCILLIGFVLSLVVFFIFLRRPGINTDSRASVVDMVRGRAWKPFAYRTLLPSAARLLSGIVPASLEARVRKSVEETPALSSWFERLEWDPHHAVEYAAVSLLIYLFLVGFAIAFRYLVAALYDGPVLLIEASPLVALAFLPSMFRHANHIYDTPSLFFFTLGLALMARRKWRWFLLCFVLACVNKETTILQTLVFYVHFRHDERMGRARFRRLLGMQLAIFVAIKVSLTVVFWHNSGTFVECHLVRNIVFLPPAQLWSTLSYFIVGLFVVYHWSDKPRLLRDATWILLPLVVFTFFLGFFDELRDLYEAYPVVVLLAMQSAAALVDVRMTPIEPGGASPEARHHH